MEFLNGPRPKILRTRLYGDQLFTRFELELLHTTTTASAISTMFILKCKNERNNAASRAYLR